MENYDTGAEHVFPSPYGVTVIKSSLNGTTIKYGFAMFPSPYGVTVIKSKGFNCQI
ncbi:hypothetical protein HMPREF9429_01766 [Megasphaera micronuciformis F0359]|uniref:Uncharacterized protein n=1 Tax=Megasphaera micronuciformis F0359 TaxID=706434 RepID=E2ZE64_9FIRM|nr:hypothetical protein HMPREF9429_01766 [Megasphaera micronuciformis F0359]